MSAATMQQPALTVYQTMKTATMSLFSLIAAALTAVLAPAVPNRAKQAKRRLGSEISRPSPRRGVSAR